MFEYHISIHTDYETFFGFGFAYIMEPETNEQVYFAWNVLPYGYTRRKMSIIICVLFDDGMSASDNEFSKK